MARADTQNKRYSSSNYLWEVQLICTTCHAAPFLLLLNYSVTCEDTLLHCCVSARHQSNLPVLDSSSAPPNLFDGTARLYIAFFSPYSQRVWSARNFKCLDQIEVIAINLADKPSWFVEKVYPVGKVPALEHNGKVIGESLDILEYIDQNFEGPALYPHHQESAKKDAVKELLTFSDLFMKEAITLARNKEATKSDAEAKFGPLLDQLEAALGKFEDEGPYFTGHFGAVDLAYAPLIERIELLLTELLNYDIYTGRPRLLKWSQAVNTVDAYTSTKCEPQVLGNFMKKLLGR